MSATAVAESTAAGAATASITAAEAVDQSGLGRVRESVTMSEGVMVTAAASICKEGGWDNT
jgi:hypothetical protein